MERWQGILDFWFGDLEEPGHPSRERYTLWFGKNETTDQAIRERFEADLTRATHGEYARWGRSPHALLALVILYDQFPRNIYRDLPEAFAYDDKALQLVLSGIEQQVDRQLEPIERVFFYLPLEHAEDPAVQEQSVVMYRQLVTQAEPNTAEKYTGYLDYALRHCEVIKQFGRFPHRNRILGRVSTPAEIAFLKQPGSSF